MKLRRADRSQLFLISAGLGATAALGALRSRADHWGASPFERSGRGAGDELIPNPQYATTRAITIDAPPTEVFAWLIQIGQGRGGFYTFDRLENLIGLNIHSVDRIVPELQRIQVGDVVPLSDLGGPTVMRMEPGRAFVLRFRMDPFTGRPLDDGLLNLGRKFEWTWAFELRPEARASTRLVVRTRARYAPKWLIAPLAAVLVEPMHFVMEREMLRGIKRRAETVVLPTARGARAA